MNPFEFLAIDPTCDIREITRICLEKSQTANEQMRAKIRDARQELLDEKKRLDFAVFTYHGADTQDSDWNRFVERHRTSPVKLKDLLSRLAPTEAEAEDGAGGAELDRFLKDAGPFEPEIDFERLTVEFLERYFAP